MALETWRSSGNETGEVTKAEKDVFGTDLIKLIATRRSTAGCNMVELF